MSVQPPANLLIERLSLGMGDACMALVTLNRPKQLNPLDWTTVQELGAALEALAADAAVRVVAFTGAGSAFSAGGDMKRYQQLQRDPVDFPRFLEDVHRVFASIAAYGKPHIALVNGVAVAGGIELILACDLAFAARSAKIGDAHLPFGQMGGGGVLSLLPRAVGPQRARELIFSGRLLDAEEALSWGLVSKVVDDGALLEAGLAFAREVAKKSSLAVANAKRVLNAGFLQGTGVPGALQLEREATARYCLTSVDAHEGLEAFAEKRAPQFVGR